MPNMIDINSRELVRFTNKLEKIGKYDLPVAVRETLNSLSFRMKGSKSENGQISITAKREFDFIRNESLFRAMTGVDKARGNNIESMVSKVGVIERSGREKVARGLAQQQRGGEIKSKSTPLDESRSGEERGNKVRPSLRLKKLVPVDLTRNSGKRFNIRALKAMKNNRAIMFRAKSGDRFVAKIKSINRNDDAEYLYDMELLYKLDESGIVRLTKKREFLTIAGYYVGKDMNNEFRRQAEKRIKRSFERR